MWTAFIRSTRDGEEILLRPTVDLKKFQPSKIIPTPMLWLAALTSQNGAQWGPPTSIFLCQM